MGYQFYYRKVESGGGTWESADESEFERICDEVAFHVTTTFVSDLPDGENKGKIRYRGDFFIDIDHKDLLAENQAPIIEAAIEDARKVQRYLLDSGVNLNCCKLFISGGKGFHIQIPVKLFDGVALNSLPMIYRNVARKLTTELGATGIDMAMYAGGKGSTIRVENKQRKNGKYKVQITWEDLDDLDAEAYLTLSSTPRPVFPAEPTQPNPVFIRLWNEANEAIKIEEELRKYKPIDEALLSAMGRVVPGCVLRLCNFEGIKDIEGRFNSAKMSLGRYLATCGLPEQEVDRLIELFSDNFPSDTYPTASLREKEVRDAMRWADKEKKQFSCGYYKQLVNDCPCSTCPIKVKQLADAQVGSNFYEAGGRYYRKATGKKDIDEALSNFTLEPIKLSYELDAEGYRSEQQFSFNVIYADPKKRPDRCRISEEGFLSTAKFKSAMKSNTQASWKGKDDDVSDLCVYITSDEKLAGITKVIPMKKQGIMRVIDAKEGIDEYAWLQRGWSWNGHVSGHIEYQGPRQQGDSGEILNYAVDLKNVVEEETLESMHCFHSLLGSRGMKEISVMLGWMGVCWLKPRLQTQPYDSMFPVLHVFGSAGAGKTELTKTYSILAGFDGIGNETINVSNCTAYSIKAMGCLTTTIPLLYDEVNETKMKDDSIRKAVREVLKSTATKQGMAQGKVTGSGESGQVSLQYTIASSPLVLMATAQNLEEEVIQRSIPLYLNKDEVELNKTYINNYMEVVKNKSLLFPYTKMLMSKAISITDGELARYWKETEWLVSEVKDPRIQKSLRCILVGLQFFKTALEEAKCSKTTLNKIQRLYDAGFLEYFNDPRYRRLKTTGGSETDNIINHLFDMAQMDDGRDGTLLKRGTHFIVDGVMIHLKIKSAFIHFKVLAERQGWMIEFATAKNFIQALEGRGYYHGVGKAPGVEAPAEWHTFSIEGLIDKGIDVNRLGSK